MHGKRMTEALNEVRSFRDTTEGGPGSGPQKGGKKFSSSEIKKAYGILNDPRYKQGNYTGAAKAINKLAPGLADHPDVKNAMKRANEELEEANRYSVALKGDAKKLFDLSWKAGSKSKAYGDKEWDAAVDDTAKKYRDDNHIRVSDKDIAAVKKAIQYNEFDPSTNEELDLSATGDTTTSNASQENEIVEEESINEFKLKDSDIEKLKKGVKQGKPIKVFKLNKPVEAGYGEDLDEAKFTPAQVSALKKAYGNFSSTGISAKQMNKLRDLMKTYSKDHLDQLAVLDIPMVSKMAKELT